MPGVCPSPDRMGKLQALAYEVFPPTTVTTDYPIGLEKLSANGQFFVGTVSKHGA